MILSIDSGMNYLIVIWLLFPLVLVGQNSPGPQATAMGGSGTAMRNIWSAQQNPAGLAGLKTPTLALSYQKNFIDQDIARHSALFAVPISVTTFALSFESYGIAAYKEQTVSASCGRAFGENLRLGITARYHQLGIERYGTATALSVAAGLQFDLTENFSLATYLSNPARTSFAEEQLSNLPVLLSLGALFKISDQVQINTEVEKMLGAAIDARMGMEYQPINWLALRGGVALNPFRQYAGFGVNHKRITIDLAVASHLNLGYSPQLALSYEF